jgi:hypothetical protein
MRRLEPQKSGDATMFEKYTEKARRVIFFSRHEASAIGGHAK